MHGYMTSALCGVPVFAWAHFVRPQRDGQAELTWAKHKALLHLSTPMCYQLTNVGTCHMVLWLTVVDTNFFVCRFDHVPVLCQNCSDSVRQDWWAGCPLWMLFCMVSVVFLLIVPLRTLVSSPLSRCTLVVFMQAVTACCNIVSSS